MWIGKHFVEPGLALEPLPAHLEVIVQHLAQLESLMLVLTNQLVAMRAGASAMLGHHLPDDVDALYVVDHHGEVTLVHRRPDSTILQIDKVRSLSIKQLLTPAPPMTAKELADLANEQGAGL